MIEKILSWYHIPKSISHLECDGATYVISHILMAHGAKHKIGIGELRWTDQSIVVPWISLPDGRLINHNGNHSIFHLWIDLPDGRRIDYKARLWAGPEAPEGIFDPVEYEKYYFKTREGEPVWQPVIVEILTGIKLESRVER